MTRMLRAALELASAGWAVLPLNGKQPVTAHGHLDASTNPREIRRMWGDQNYNIGSPVPDNLLVLDLDPRNGGDLAALEQRAGVALPETLEVVSGRRDGGRHLYYLRPFAKPDRSRIPHGIDVKTNGYMVMPPSIHPDSNRAYRWVSREVAKLPREVVSLMTPRRAVRRPESKRSDAVALAAWVRTLRPGERHDGLVWAAARLHECGARDHHLERLIDAATDIGFSDHEARRVVESARMVAEQ